MWVPIRELARRVPAEDFGIDAPEGLTLLG